MSIKKALKKERFKRGRDIALSMIIMIVMAYFVAILIEKEVLTGFESYFSLFYVICVDILLIGNILRILSEGKVSFDVKGDKLKIYGGYFSPSYMLPIKKILYVDVHKISPKEFKVILITKKFNRKKYKDFDDFYVKKNPEYTSTLEYIKSNYNENDKFSCIEVKSSGSRKYYLLYALYKSMGNIEFSKEAIEYIKRFMKEYKL